ncbi:hypothetical protein HQN89_36665 [Paenibacillus frigoriresistens]|uniref:hypothetical protein n=1 Tax=Paenibacillus alginolyticus TaxID=59839 RepID=UPI001565E8F3|nr:hypothetical protein [Paenibacillus frigoriresistens]NRF96287.1 hypothetical protein [Paenibacillus frigoriresistens]
MSKGRVWNKGKRNGGGGPAPGTGYKEKLAAAMQADGKPVEVIDLKNPINQVQRMNRENWVERPVRVNREQPKK